MRKVYFGALMLMGLVGILYAASFTDIDTPQYYGKTADHKRNEAIDANFALVESGQFMTATALAATNGQVLAVTTAYMRVTPSAVATCTVANATSAGQVVVIENVGTNNLILEDNGTTLALGGNITNGTTDTVMLIYSAAGQWRKLSSSNN